MTSIQRQSTRQPKKPDAAAAFQHILTLPSAAAQKEKRSYKCAHCSTTFRRSEHCIRHERSHTLEKPFGCSVCECRFSRKDLLVRHERTVHSSNRVASSQRPAKRQRTNAEDEANAQVSLAAFVPDQQQSIDGGETFPSGNDCFSGLSPTGSSPGSVRQSQRRGASLSIPEGVQPLTPLSSDMSNRGLRRRSTILERNDGIEFDAMDEGLGFSILFPNVDAEEGDSLSPSSLEQDIGFSAVATEIHDLFPARDSQFSEFHDLEHIIHGSSPDGSMTDLFHGSVAGTCSSGLTPINEYSIPQVPPARPREGRETDVSDMSSHSLSSSSLSRKGTGLVIDGATREWILQDLSTSHPRDLMTGFCLPNSTALQRYLENYFKGFHKQFPILHLPTFYPKGTKALLLLAVCCIGAQYCLEKRRARYLFEWTKRFLAVEDVRWKRVEVERKAWLVRSKLLLGFFGIWSAERDLVSDVISEQGWFAGFFRSAQALLLRREETPVEQLTWRDWVDIESFKRLCYGIFILQSHIAITYNVPPALSCSEICLPLPAAEDFWESPSSELWDAQLAFAPSSEPTYHEALEHHFGASAQAQPSDSEPGPTAFGGLVLVHGLLSQQWQVLQCRQSLQLFGFSASAASPFTTAQESEKLLGRLQRCLIYTHQNISSTAGGTLWFSAAALLRQAYIRQFTQFEPTSAGMRTILRPEEATLDVDAVVCYVLAGTLRGSAITRAAEKASETLEMPIRAGHVMVRKTAALNWSIDHVLAGWDCILYLLRWMFTLETTPHSEWDTEERRVYECVRALLEETDLDLRAEALTPALAGMWGDFLADTWVWGITPALGHGMKSLAERLGAALETV